MKRVRKRWILLAALCGGLSVIAWGMVDDLRATFRSFESSLGLTPRDIAMGRPVRAVALGGDGTFGLHFDRLNAQSQAFHLIDVAEVASADALIVVLPSWKEAAQIDTRLLPPSLRVQLLSLPDRQPAAFQTLLRQGAGPLQIVALNRAGMAAATPFCVALMGHDLARFWDGQAEIYGQYDRFRFHTCAAQRWTALPGTAPRW